MGRRRRSREFKNSDMRNPVSLVRIGNSLGLPCAQSRRRADWRAPRAGSSLVCIRLPATSVLNSAYLNVSAIALRFALASQQNWTTLRTIVLDDPILEMDSLTQSALIDGVEAILASPHSPWTNLQVIITTWSEDFPVLAAHKLAHLNVSKALGDDQFVTYRLGSLPDGCVPKPGAARASLDEASHSGSTSRPTHARCSRCGRAIAGFERYG